MSEFREWNYEGHAGAIYARSWDNPDAKFCALLCHGYGEHIGRYDHVADALVRAGAEVHGADHVGHGRSDGERVLVRDYEAVVDDFHRLAEKVNSRDLPLVLIGHSMGGMIASRYAQRFGNELTALVLSGPVLGRWDAAAGLLAAEEIPEVPIDPETLSRDPEVGRLYESDPLVWHGKFKRTTLEALMNCIETINDAGSLGRLPTLWVHGEDDALVPIEGTRQGIDKIRGSLFSQKMYPGARHEVFNETNKSEVLRDVTSFVLEIVEAPE
ncbi:alpha/beta hydrolase [Hoyosella altamirensis]|uniref:Alpha-beta hydrolase superfamily lysophospholipase n=1 Tax=Hoyosella altamirensis TaxID=616997 RepID=A0A839RQK7_9ACTN|nr:alpha/beta hydrolase [Hoyosella altamirensis]MBB3039075.1 alpha-beta hydrolase superfamily lysophospholipase [Hoyosella altamirensis]